MADVDLDFGSRTDILARIDYTAATLENGRVHPSGVYVTAAPQNPLTGLCSLDYRTAEKFGYFKIDFLNNNLYRQVRSPEHLEQLLARPVHWSRLLDKKFVARLIHIGNYADLIGRLPEPITDVEHLAMFLALIRPGKKHLQGKPWPVVAQTVWDRNSSDKYSFRKAHALAYALLICLQMNLLEEQERAQ